MKVAILGNGTISKGVQDILRNSLKDVEIVKILDIHQYDDPLFTTDINDIINSDAETVMEMIVGDDPTYSYIKAILNSKKNVITSNKVTVSSHLEEYISLAKENGVQFRFEASVAGGIPWIEALIKAKRLDTISSVSGIMNGTTNYILDHMERDQLDFNVMLKSAQELGYAEADPTNDIDGLDVLRKVMISSSLAFGGITDLDAISCHGIRDITLEDINYFAKLDKKVRLIGAAFKNDDKYAAFIEPCLFNKTDIESSILENNNITTLNGNYIGRISIIGQGAGKYPTADAMVQDLLDIIDNRHNSFDFSNVLVADATSFKAKYIFKTKHSEFFVDIIDKVDGNYIYTQEISASLKDEIANKVKEEDSKLFYVRIA